MGFVPVPNASDIPRPNVTIIDISEDERKAGVPTDETVFRALEALHRDGIVALGNAVNLEHEDAVNRQMCADADYLKSKDALWHIQGRETGNVSLSPPLNKDLFFQDIYANPFCLHVLKYVLGPAPEVRFIRSNVALRGTARQQVHSDMDFPFPEMPFCYTINTILCDSTEENGATEVWLGTHKNASITEHVAPNEPYIKKELLEARAKVVPPIRAVLPKGSIVIRDPRTWHSGIANTTDVPRVMLSEMLFAKWYGNRLAPTLPEELRPTLEEWSKDGLISFQAHFVKGQVDHLELSGLEAVTGTAAEDYKSPNNFPFEGKVQPSIPPAGAVLGTVN
jgi:hypothetical protein